MIFVVQGLSSKAFIEDNFNQPQDIQADFGASSDIGGYLGGNIHGGGDLDVSNLVNSSGNLSGGGFIRGRGEICEVFN
ncbi:hypothetical protein G6F56_006186 [Rhizopus delemar]|nr:hypothetical protein G6F56_006186 [Rhizopus delemar]